MELFFVPFLFLLLACCQHQMYRLCMLHCVSGPGTFHIDKYIYFLIAYQKNICYVMCYALNNQEKTER